jgi:hypothetical protein
MTNKQLMLAYCLEVLAFCRESLGESKYVKEPVKLKISYRKGLKYTGEYREKTNEIYVYPLTLDKNLSGGDMAIITIIHEYVHYTQDLGIYDRIAKHSGYIGNVLEVEADAIARLLLPSCKKYLRAKKLTFPLNKEP